MKALLYGIDSLKYGNWKKGSNDKGQWVKEVNTGLIIQWGYYTKNNYYPIVELPIAFTTTSYSVATSMTDGAYEGGCSIRNYTLTTFTKQSQGGGPFRWIAIGF